MTVGTPRMHKSGKSMAREHGMMSGLWKCRQDEDYKAEEG